MQCNVIDDIIIMSQNIATLDVAHMLGTLIGEDMRKIIIIHMSFLVRNFDIYVDIVVFITFGRQFTFKQLSKECLSILPIPHTLYTEKNENNRI